MGAYPHDIERALNAGVEFVHWVAPLRILGDGAVASLVCRRTEILDGALTMIERSEFEIPATIVLRATGQAKRAGFIEDVGGVTTDSSGRVVVDEGFRTENPRIWAGGDCVNGGKEVVNAVAHGKSAAQSIDAALQAETVRSVESDGT